MQRLQFTTWAFLALLGFASSTSVMGQASAQDGGQEQASLGVKSALERGIGTAIAALGRADGFMSNPRVRIALPPALEKAAPILKMTGQQKKVDELVTAMNRAAEAAVPKTQDLLVAAVRQMSVGDAWNMVRGSETAVTDYFRAHTQAPLSESLLPVVTQATGKVSLAAKYNALAAKAGKLGVLKNNDATVQAYVTRKTLDGLYLMIGEEEKKIRADPVGTGSELLKKIFSRG